MKDWHGAFGGRKWRVTADGIQSRGEDGVQLHRTHGQPRTMRLYLASWGPELISAARLEKVPLTLLLMVVATENGPADLVDNRPNVLPPRREPGYTSDQETPHRISVGPCHVLISTAREALGDPSVGRRELQDVATNLRAAAAVIARQKDDTGLDPVLVSAAYNAGGVYRAIPGESRFGNRWHLRTYGSHLDRAASWYGDACQVLQEHHELVSMDLGGLGRSGVRAA